MTLTKFQKKSLLVFISVLLIIWAVNFAFIQGAFLSNYIRIENWWLVYLILIPQFLISYYFVQKKAGVQAKIPDVGKVFILTLTLRMILALCYLGPWLFFKDETSRPMVGQFFYVFFSLLIVEISLLVSYLNQSVLEIEKDEQKH